ncbi:pullulanase X25 domain-containing protein [Nakamurella multipartita]|uniref:Alpha-amylase n=1 Tax=Nakamurella multipartita (strain ATCC 700099 / DSM 44233 / CIP 104796 / JCM 9543 / NBRC 105858 / Y-104) TaxID=479431 RepID=C8XC68_NAKMY|nr:alpha-amylase family glycosyl hydrolase [Nakamurella multipartita]ACV81462.1 Alpha-amylase [Nakamurella multipartita DSM 44233]
MTRPALRRLGTVALAATLAVTINQVVAPAAAAETTSVTVAGSFDQEIGCADDWQPACAAAHLDKQPNGQFAKTLTIPDSGSGATSYGYKFATNDSWNNPNFGLRGGSGDIALPIPAGGQNVTFVFDPVSNLGSDSINSAAISGTFQRQLGCAADNTLSCPQSWLYDDDHDGVFTLVTGAIAPGSYTVSAATLGSSSGSAPVTFTVPAAGGGATTTISFDPKAGAPTVSVVPLVQPAPATFSHPTAKRGDVVANLFEWNWKSVSTECQTVLGPAGYGAVQVAPPQNSINNPDGGGHPWWEVYQPVSYSLNSRMGSEDDFKAMVKTCRAAGVQVIVDTVINHMTGQGSTSYDPATTGWTHTNYPGLYSAADFHTSPADCPEASNTIDDFNDYRQVTQCQLVGLADLRTESDAVRTQIAGYLNKLLSYGVTGFRVDAAKHIGQADLAAIVKKLNRTVDGKRPYIALEVPPGGPGKLTPFAFQDQGNLLGFDFATQVKAAFTSNLTDLTVFGEDAGLLPSDHSLVFVQNHDTERDGTTLSYKNGPTNTLATEFMLAYGYGRAEVYSGFVFANKDDSPPADANGFVTDANCDNGWACTHRSRGVANLVDFHNFVGDAPVRNVDDDGVNLLAFSRGNKGWIALNNHDTPQTRTFSTGLLPGVYCDVIHGTYSQASRGKSCDGPTVTVGSSGKATVTVPAKDAVAFSAGNRVGR